MTVLCSMFFEWESSIIHISWWATSCSWGDHVKATHCVTAGQYMLDRSCLWSLSGVDYDGSDSVSHTTKITKRRPKQNFLSACEPSGALTVTKINKPLPQHSCSLQHTSRPQLGLGVQNPSVQAMAPPAHFLFLSVKKTITASGQQTHTLTRMLIYTRLRDTMMVINFSLWIMESRGKECAYAGTFRSHWVGWGQRWSE